jgi:hypothetical protein
MDLFARLVVAADRPANRGTGVVGVLASAFGVLAGAFREDGGAARGRQKGAVNDAPYEYGPARVENFPWLDARYYATAQHELEQAGFRCFGDVENLSISSAFPRFRTAIRELVSGDGTVIAFVWQIRDRRFLGRRRTDIRAVELRTEFSDGTFLSTTNHPGPAGGYSKPRNEETQVCAAMPPGRLLGAHREAVAAVLGRRPLVSAMLVHTGRELRHAVERAHVLRCVAKLMADESVSLQPAGALNGVGV